MTRDTRRPRAGFAMMAALWLVVIIGATGYELAVRSRARRLAALNSIERVQAIAAADAGIATVRAQLEEWAARPLQVTTQVAGAQTFDRWGKLTGLQKDTIALGQERAFARVYDAGSRLQINLATEADIRRLLAAIPLDAALADRLAQRIMDWRDADDFPRSRGAERAGYLRIGARKLPSNAEFTNVGELRDIDGMTPDLFRRIVPFIAVRGTGQVNVNTAPLPVLQSLPGLGAEAISVIVRMRASSTPLRSLEELRLRLSSRAREEMADAGGELAQRMTFETRELIVDAEGWVDGSPVRARTTAMFARGGDAVFLEWRRTEP